MLTHHNPTTQQLPPSPTHTSQKEEAHTPSTGLRPPHHHDLPEHRLTGVGRLSNSRIWPTERI